MKAYDILVSRGDTVPIVFTLKLNGVVINLTGATVKFYLMDSQNWRGQHYNAPLSEFNDGTATTTAGIGGLKVSAASVALTDAVNGGVTITPLAAWFDTPGDYIYQFKVTYGDGTIESVPNLEDEPLPRIRVGPGLSSLA